MESNDYKKAFENALMRLAELGVQSDAIEVERAKLKRFMLASLEMMDEEDRIHYRGEFQKAAEESDRREVGLTDSIRRILERHKGRWLTASEVRDRLRESGFDFTGYMSNPLASVSTTLTRMYPKQVDKTDVEGVTAYRIKRSVVSAIRAAKRRAFIGSSEVGPPPLTEKAKEILTKAVEDMPKRESPMPERKK